MSSKYDRPASKAAWSERAGAAISMLKTLSPNEFYDESSRKRHPVYAEISVLAWALETDADSFRRFLTAFPQVRGWLPEEPAALIAMTDEEVLFRLRTNVSGERWVDGALMEPFQSGTLVAAIERLVAGIDRFEIMRD
jgi:hypothetical protein